MPDDPRFEMRDELIEDLLRQIGKNVYNELPQGFGFGLIIFKYNGPEFFWISSGQRDDMIKALREFIARESVN